MKKCLYFAAFLCFGLALHAETPVTMRAPFEFVAGGKTLPAGDYHMKMLTPGVVLIAGDSGSRVLALVSVSDGAAAPAAAFDTTGAEPVLARISSTAGTWTFTGAEPSHLAIGLRPKNAALK